MMLSFSPTSDMKKWIGGETVNFKDGTRARLYVTIARARSDLVFVV